MANESFDGFSDHEILEMILYYSKARGDTNPCAHALMERFGSIKTIFEASVDELCTVEGIGTSSAILIQLISESMRRYIGELAAPVPCYDTMSKIADYLYRLFLGLDHERLYMLMFNDRLNLIDCVLISRGTINSSDVPMRKILNKVLFKKATSVVLAHNHPGGVSVPSDSDLEVTDQIKNVLEMMDVVLLEHFIFADRSFLPLIRRRYGRYRPEPIKRQTESFFYETFYDLEEGEYTINPRFDIHLMKKKKEKPLQADENKDRSV